MSSPIADGVLAATHKLVRQAMTGQWQDVPKTIEERRLLLDQLNASATPQDQQWLSALRQAMAESDAAVAKMVPACGDRQSPCSNATENPVVTPTVQPESSQVDAVFDMITRSR